MVDYPPQEDLTTDGIGIYLTDSSVADQVNVTDAHIMNHSPPDQGGDETDLSLSPALHAEVQIPTLADAALDASVPIESSQPDLNCQEISDANPEYEVCSASPDQCEGVFTDGAGCTAFCAAGGLACIARYGGESGCRSEPENMVA